MKRNVDAILEIVLDRQQQKLQRLLQEERERHEQMMVAHQRKNDEFEQFRRQLMRPIELVCCGGNASTLCKVTCNCDGGIVERVVDHSGLTFEDFRPEPDSLFATRFAAANEGLLTPSTTSPSTRPGREYLGKDLVQVATHNGAMWWNATAKKQRLIVSLVAPCFSTQIKYVRLTSVRLQDCLDFTRIAEMLCFCGCGGTGAHAHL